MVREHTTRVKQPRALFVPYPFGHPLGDADDRPGQLRVIRAALALLERSAGPVLEDFADERYAAREELNLPQAASVPSTPKDVDPADEISALRPWHEAWLREHDGRTGIGLSGVDPRRFREVIRFLQDYAAGKDGEPPESSAGVPVPRFIRLVADDPDVAIAVARLVLQFGVDAVAAGRQAREQIDQARPQAGASHGEQAVAQRRDPLRQKAR